MTTSEKDGRVASCSYCSRTLPSNSNMPFFEDRSGGSKIAIQTCKHCRCYPQAHVRREDGQYPSVIGRPHAFEAHGEYQTDRFYCGCRGWE